MSNNNISIDKMRIVSGRSGLYDTEFEYFEVFISPEAAEAYYLDQIKTNEEIDWIEICTVKIIDNKFVTDEILKSYHTPW